MLFPDDEKKTGGDLHRLTNVKYTDASVKFQLKKKSDYSKQYAHIYAQRLIEMRPILSFKAVEEWGANYPIKKLTDLREDNPEKCIIIGTTFVHQRLKPSILKEISEETQLAPQPIRHNYVEESDILVLEDEDQRIQLLGKLDAHKLVTGVVCAILGYENNEGKFSVEDCLFYECGPQKPLKTLDDSPLVVFISGLDQSSTHDFSVSLDLFQQWLQGNLPNVDNEPDFEAANVVRVIVAGNSIRTSMEVRPRTILMRQPESVTTLEAVRSVDDLVAGWSKSVYVDLMPGEFDPANCMLPQQPMHHCMFPNSAVNSAFKCVTNPYAFEIEDRFIIGTSGQNVTNIQKFSSIDNFLDVLKSMVQWSILAPTAPDTLPCYPYTECDPFLIKECPHVLFAGNSPEYQTSLYEGSGGKKVRLICIPQFSKTESVVVINLRTLECNQLGFKYNSLDDFEM